MDTKRFNEEHAAKSRAVCERIEREDAELRGKLADLVDAQLKSELGRAKAEADGWRKIAERRLKHTEECEKALAKRNERVAELEKQVGYLRAELANAKVLSERERQILDMWPRFEDGEYVWFWDEYKCWCGESHTFDGVSLISNGGVIIETFERSHDATHRSGFASGEFVKRPAPKVLDADGVEIKFGDTVWDGDGVEMVVMSLVGELPGHVTTHSKIPPAMHSIDPKRLTHTPPDSWKQLEEDAAKGVCEYAGAERKPGSIDAHTCCGCRFDEDGDGPTCEKQMALDIIRRAKALAGVEAGE